MTKQVKVLVMLGVIIFSVVLGWFVFRQTVREWAWLHTDKEQRLDGILLTLQNEGTNDVDLEIIVNVLVQLDLEERNHITFMVDAVNLNLGIKMATNPYINNSGKRFNTYNKNLSRLIELAKIYQNHKKGG